MKTRFFMAALAALAIVGCNKELGNTELPEVNGESAVLKVNLKAAGTMTKADPGTYEYGTDDESAVNTVNFYFFAANGSAYPVVTGSNTIAWTPGDLTSSTAKPSVSVEAVSDVVLVIKQSQTALPAKVVAVINQTQDFKNLDLATFGATALDALKTNGGAFVMSNAVYADGNVVVNATDILPENIFTSADGLGEAGSVIDANKVSSLNINPVDIYVERVAAKVKVAANTGVNLEKIPVMNGNTQMVDADDNKVYVKVLGWDVTNYTTEARLLKDINPAWNRGYAWNDAADFRSYWASTTAQPAHTHTFEDLIGKNMKVKENYYFENTLPVGNGVNTLASAAGDNQTPQLLVAAQLVNEAGNAVRLAKWYNVLYTIDGLKTAMVNQVASKLYVVDSVTEDGFGGTKTTYRSVNVGDVTFVQTAHTAKEKRYEVNMVALDKEYYSPEGAKEGTALTEAQVEAIIAGVDPAQMWETGYTYYFLNIKHFGNDTGLVRNHVYSVVLDGVGSFGTPVFDPKEIIVPEVPKDQPAANLAAQINILSWSVVSQNVTLQ
jgi:hypothetical protein